jgi:flavin reductase (DIM6/NTAB) family NADH-FMN oxidoreductase RutF
VKNRITPITMTLTPMTAMIARHADLALALRRRRIQQAYRQTAPLRPTSPTDVTAAQAALLEYPTHMELSPDDLAPRERYKLMIGCIVPRPIAFVSTVSLDGRFNLAPFSFFNGVGSDPMTVMFCPANREDGGDKDTLLNCRPPEEGGVGQFVVNAAVEDYRHKVAAAAEALEHGDSEFELVGLTPAASRVVKPPRVAEAPWAFECETLQVIRTNPGVPGGGNAVLGRVVHVWARDDVVNQRRIVDAEALGAIGRMGGFDYCTTRDRFTMPVGRAALELDSSS